MVIGRVMVIGPAIGHQPDPAKAAPVKDGSIIQIIAATHPTVIAERTTNLVREIADKVIVPERAQVIVQALVPARVIGLRPGRLAEIDLVAAGVPQIVRQHGRPAETKSAIALRRGAVMAIAAAGLAAVAEIMRAPAAVAAEGAWAVADSVAEAAVVVVALVEVAEAAADAGVEVAAGEEDVGKI